jgi:hypothetical protein
VLQNIRNTDFSPYKNFSVKSLYNFTNTTKGTPIKTPSLLEQFRSFYTQNQPNTLEQAVEYFSVFGGLGFEVDMDEDLEILIDDLILDNYDSLHKDITEVTEADPLLHSVLSGVALGDRRSHSAYKRARVNGEDGDRAIALGIEKGILSKESPKNNSYLQETPLSPKLSFAIPFVRFWFAFVSPLFKGIKEGDYEEIHTKFANHRQEFVTFIYEELCKELLKLSFKADPITEIGSFWNSDIDIELYAKTASGKKIAGIVRTSKQKMKKSELTKLRENCESANLNIDIFVLFNKNGFSNELKNLKGEDLKLFTLKNFKSLVE